MPKRRGAWGASERALLQEAARHRDLAFAAGLSWHHDGLRAADPGCGARHHELFVLDADTGRRRVIICDTDPGRPGKAAMPVRANTLWGDCGPTAVQAAGHGAGRTTTMQATGGCSIRRRH